MMRLPEFQYLAPTTVAEAARILADEGPTAMLAAGGTDLYPNMKRRLFTPKYVVGLHGLPEMRGIHTNNGGPVRIGASATLSEVEASPVVRARYPALARAAALVSTPQLRNMGTIGGNICLDTRCNYYDQSAFWRQALGYCLKKDADICRVAPSSSICLATHSADTVPVLMAYDARVTLVSAEGERQVAVGDLYQNDGIHFLRLQPGEIVTEVTLPPPEGLRATYWKLRDRGSFDFPIAGLAAAARFAPDGTCTDLRLVLTGVFSSPQHLTEAEQMVRGQRLTDGVIQAAADAAFQQARPVDNTGGTIIQRRRSIRAFVVRALEELAAGEVVAGSEMIEE